MKAVKKTDKNLVIKVYYNSACPVCDKGINWQKGKMNNCDISWNDIHSDHQLMDEIDKELEIVRKYLHISVEDKTYVGFEAFIKLWENSPKETWKAKLSSLPVIRPFCIYIYFAFAHLLYGWNKLCKRW